MYGITRSRELLTAELLNCMNHITVYNHFHYIINRQFYPYIHVTREHNDAFAAVESKRQHLHYRPGAVSVFLSDVSILPLVL